MNIKGALLSGTISFVKNNFGDDGFDKVLSQMSEEEQKLLTLDIPDSMYYPYELYYNFSKVIIDTFFDGDITCARKIGEYTAQYGMHTHYRIFIKLGSPEFIIKNSTRAFSTYFDIGEMETLIMKGGYFLIELRNLSRYDMIVLDRIAGWMQRVMEISGAKKVDVNVNIFKKESASVARFEGRWEK